MEEMELELGTLLKKAREEKGLSLDDIQEETKIRKKYLEAIEENNFDVLPGKVYLKVFVKGYAREVDINYQALLENYDILNIKEKKESNLQKDYLNGTKVPSGSRNKDRKNPFKIIFVVLLIIFLGAAAVYTFQYINDSEIRLLNQQNNEETDIEEESQLVELSEEQAEKAKTEPGEQDSETIGEFNNDSSSLESDINSAAAADDNNQGLDLKLLDSFDSNLLNEDNIEIIEKNSFDELDEFNYQEKNEITEMILSEEEKQLGNEEDKQINNDNLVETDQKSVSEEIQTENNEQVSSANEENVLENNEAAAEDDNIIIRASDTVWITVDLDGETAFSGILEAGDQQEFEIENKLYIKIGNGNAITANIDGNSYGPWAGNGEIAEVEFLNEDGEIDINNLRE